MKHEVEKGVAGNTETIKSPNEFFNQFKEHVLREIDEANLPFHCAEHTMLVIDRVERIISVFMRHELASGKDMALAKISALFHDYVHDSRIEKVVVDGFSIHMRKRVAGESERKTADVVKILLEKFYDSNANLTEDETEDIRVVCESIIATTPRFVNGTVVQDKFTKDASLVAQSLMLADLGTAGMSSDRYQFLVETRRDFLERYVELTGYEGIYVNKFSQDKQKFYFEKMIQAIQNQVNFIEGLKTQFKKQILVLPGAVREEVANMFSNFDMHIEMARRDYNFAYRLPDFYSVLEYMLANKALIEEKLS